MSPGLANGRTELKPADGARAQVRLRVRDVVRMLEQDGWYVVGGKGSHRQFRHPTKPGKVTVAGTPAIELGHKAVRSILKQAGLSKGGP